MLLDTSYPHSYVREDLQYETKDEYMDHPGAKWTKFTTEENDRDYWNDGTRSVWHEPAAVKDYTNLCSQWKEVRTRVRARFQV